MSRHTVPVFAQYYSAPLYFKYSSVPNVTCRSNLLGARIPCFVTITKCHQLSSVSVFVLYKRLLDVDSVLQGKVY